MIGPKGYFHRDFHGVFTGSCSCRDHGRWKCGWDVWLRLVFGLWAKGTCTLGGLRKLGAVKKRSRRRTMAPPINKSSSLSVLRRYVGLLGSGFHSAGMRLRCLNCGLAQRVRGGRLSSVRELSWLKHHKLSLQHAKCVSNLCSP